jgi:hypothetical protein
MASAAGMKLKVYCNEHVMYDALMVSRVMHSSTRTGVINEGISNSHKQESQLPAMDVQRKVSL